MVQLENELTQTQTNLDTASVNLEEKEKALQNVSSEKKSAGERGGCGARDEFRGRDRFPGLADGRISSLRTFPQSSRVWRLLCVTKNPE